MNIIRLCRNAGAAHHALVCCPSNPVDRPLKDWDDILGFSLRLAHGVAYRHSVRMLRSVGLTQKQISVLWLVAEHPGGTQADIAKRLQLDRATVLAIVNRLVKLCYLAKVNSGTDGRKQVLNLLPAGVAGLDSAKQAVRCHEEWLRGRLTGQQVTTLLTLLRCIHG